MKKQRPVNLDLLTIRFPITAISSILFRVSGVIVFMALGILLWLLDLSLSSPEGFKRAVVIMDCFFVKCILWGIMTILAFHTIGGIRHMLMDFGYLDKTLAVGRQSTWIIFGITFVFSIFFGVLVW